MSRWTGSLALGLLALGLLPSCARPAAPAAPPALTAGLEQSRDDESRSQLEVVLTAGGAAVVVTGLQLRGGGFTQVPPTPLARVVAAGSRAVLPIAYGTALCAGRPAPVAVLVDTPTGRREVDVTGDTLLPALRARECAAADPAAATPAPAPAAAG